MYFKAKKGTVAHTKITEFLKSIHEQKKANIKALEDSTGIKFTKYYSQRTIFDLCGAITSIKPDPRKNPKDQALQDLNLQQDWTIDKYAEKQGNPGFYRPNTRRTSGRMIAQFIKEQKTFTFQDDNRLFGIKRKFEEGRWSHAGYTERKNYVLVNMNDTVITPIPGLIEITVTEYNKLKGKGK